MATKHTYYTAATEVNPNKAGFNRIEWEDNDILAPEEYINTESSSRENAEHPAVFGWTEKNREYFPVAPASALDDEQIIAAFKRLKELGLVK